jgi:hypothetical protein
VPEVLLDTPPLNALGPESGASNRALCLALWLIEAAPGPVWDDLRASLREDLAHGLARSRELLGAETWKELEALQAAAQPPPAGEVANARAQSWAAAEAALHARIEPASRRGRAQILGGVLAEDRVGPEALFLLPRGRELVLELEALVAAPGLYPLAIEVQVDGEPRGELVLAGPARRAHFTCDVSGDVGAFEVLLRARDWGRLALGERQEPCAARLVALEVRP